MNKEFFWTLFKRATAKEDIFTECLVETLRLDPTFAERFAAILLLRNRAGLVPGKVKAFDTQVNYPGAVPDILLELDSGEKVFIENKMDAPEGKDQLKRYLGIQDLDALAFITRSYRKGIDPQVLVDPKYLVPAEREHFLWSDFHDLTESRSGEENASPAVHAFLYLLKSLGQRPDRSQTRKWRDDTPEEEKFRKWFLSPLYEQLKSLGWKVNFDQKGREIYAKKGPAGKVKRLYLNTWTNPGEFYLRVDLQEGTEIRGMTSDSLGQPELSEDVTIKVIPPTKAEPGRKALDFSIAKDNLFRGLKDDEGRRKRVADFVMSIYKGIEKYPAEA